MMKHYADWNGNSGVRRYDDSQPGVIFVEFNMDRNEQYRYEARAAGALHINEMKKLAGGGFGLARYISANRTELHGQRLTGTDQRN